MMTTHQLKAARALLGWTQADLAKAAGMHLNVINNIERGTTNPRQQTVERLQAALEQSGIAFLGTRGVELTRQAVTITKFEGENFLRAFTDDILAHAHGADTEVLSILHDIRNFDAHDAVTAKAYYAAKSERGFSERLLTRDMPGFYPRQSQQYRVVAPEALGPVDTVTYADRVALLFWDAGEAVVIRNPDYAATQRRLFETLWAQGHEPLRPLRAAED